MARIDTIPKTFDPTEAEPRLYADWVSSGHFHPRPDPAKKPFTIVIPPPNITGQLHMGHALNNTLQDILIRAKRMQGFAALWLPGADHASIATEAKIVEKMAQEGLTKKDIGREAFLVRAWDWKREYGGRIMEQLRRLGSSCDWERERFTMDEGLSRAVNEVFVRLYRKGLVYRGERIINWCPKCLTTISDAEVEFEEREGHLWHIRYPFADGSGFMTVATTRPETMLGDMAVAVHPEDERYKALVGKTLVLPLMDRPIPLIADTYVEKDFGTGAVKITPAHDPNDFEVGARHKLPIVDVMTPDAHMSAAAGPYAGLDRYAARRRIVADLEALGLLVKTEPHKHNVGTCYRCGTTVEPRVSLQWFVHMEPLAGPAIDAVRDGRTTFVPERFAKTYFNWMENIRDWCISRQLWWGHRIPAWYCDGCGETVVDTVQPTVCPHCGSASLRQDEDTLDTWFSSALWPFSTLGWPDSTEDLKYFYPTDVLVTAYEIIFFWVARMIFSGLEFMGREPFHHVLITGLIRDEQGRKMSKSLGNGVDPLDVIDRTGADALRFALVSGAALGIDQRMSDEKIEAGRNFVNKIWNAHRFVLMNFEDDLDFSGVDSSCFTMEDRWILSRFNSVAVEVTSNLEKFEIGLALGKVHGFLWDEFCDWYIEMTKPRLFDKSAPGRLEAQYVLNRVLGGAMQLLHPFMPFVTEAVYQNLIHPEGSIVVSTWPVFDPLLDRPNEERQMAILMDAVRSLRNLRTGLAVPPSRKAAIVVVSQDKTVLAMFSSGGALLERLAAVSSVEVRSSREGIPSTSVTAVFGGGELFVPLEDLIDVGKEIERLSQERERLDKEIERVGAKLSNEEFVAKAPARVIDVEREKLAKYEEMRHAVLSRLAAMTKS